jgi:amidase
MIGQQHRPNRPGRPSLWALRAAADRHGLDLTDAELRDYGQMMDEPLESYRRIDELPEPRPEVRYPRDRGQRPDPDDNPLGAWFWRTAIRGAADGPLAGMTVAIKDNVCVADVPMANGAALLDGFVPDIDATVVTRILDAGGQIAGKAVCESLCFSDGSHTSDSGPVCNPHDPTRTTGGSSSGSAALVVSGACDVAIGGDQGGSITMPSALCGAYGLKPTHGLVPYTGIFPLERTLDHVGPIARSPLGAALLLTAIAGPDGLDPRQSGVAGRDYATGIDDGIDGLRVGVLEQGFGTPVSERDVDAAVEDAIGRIGALGATVERVSVPWHSDAAHVWNAIVTEGALAQVLYGNGGGTNAKGFYDTTLIDAFRRARAAKPDDLAPTVKLSLLLGEYMQTRYGGRYYAKAQNLALSVTRAYDAALASHDVLVMPTVPMTAPLLPPPDAPPAVTVARAGELHANTCPFNVSGHPTISIPCATVDGLPVGLMAVGRPFDEATLLRLARVCEQTFAPTLVAGAG